jgi:hypothetical protein
VGMGWRASWMTWEHFVTIFSWWESIEELLQWHGNTLSLLFHWCHPHSI